MRDFAALHPDAPRLVPDEPLPRYRFQEGLHPHPRRDPRGHSFGAPMPAPGLPPGRWREDRSFLLGIDLFHQGYLWEAHEAWEAGFFATRDPHHRRLLQALVQTAAAAYQAHRGRGAGVRLLAGAAAAKLRDVADAAPPGARYAGLDVRSLLSQVERHFGPALDPRSSDEDAARTVGPPPRLEVGP